MVRWLLLHTCAFLFMRKEGRYVVRKCARVRTNHVQHILHTERVSAAARSFDLFSFDDPLVVVAEKGVAA